MHRQLVSNPDDRGAGYGAQVRSNRGRLRGHEFPRTDPLAARAMAEAGVDISRSASMRAAHIGVPFDMVVLTWSSPSALGP